MNKAFEKILEKLEILKFPIPDECPSYCGNTNTLLDMAKQIVNQVAEEYNNGWIPCSERLPEDGTDVLVQFEYYRYGSYNRLFQAIGISYTYDGEWSGFVNGSSGWSNLRIIAWMPLPKSYKESD